MIILLLDSFKKKKKKLKLNIQGYIGRFSENFIKLNSFHSNSSKFWRKLKFEILTKQRRVNVLSYSFHSLSLIKLSIKRMNFPFLSLKLSNKGMKKYSKIVHFILFHSILDLQSSPIEAHENYVIPFLSIVQQKLTFGDFS